MQAWRGTQPHEQAEKLAEVVKGLFFPHHVGKEILLTTRSVVGSNCPQPHCRQEIWHTEAPQGAQGSSSPCLTETVRQDGQEMECPAPS